MTLRDEALQAWIDKWGSPGDNPETAFEGNKKAQNDWVQHYSSNQDFYKKSAPSLNTSPMPNRNMNYFQPSLDQQVSNLEGQMPSTFPGIAPAQVDPVAQQPAPMPQVPDYMTQLKQIRDAQSVNPNPAILASRNQDLGAPAGTPTSPQEAANPTVALNLPKTGPMEPSDADKLVRENPFDTSDSDKLIRQNPFDAPSQQAKPADKGNFMTGMMAGLGQAAGQIQKTQNDNQRIFDTIFGSTNAYAMRPLQFNNPVLGRMSDKNVKKDIKPANKNLQKFLDEIYRRSNGR